MWDGERIGRRKKKRAHGGRWEGEREDARPLGAPPPPPPFLSSHRPRRALFFSIIAAIGSLCGEES